MINVFKFGGDVYSGFAKMGKVCHKASHHDRWVVVKLLLDRLIYAGWPKNDFTVYIRYAYEKPDRDEYLRRLRTDTTPTDPLVVANPEGGHVYLSAADKVEVKGSGDPLKVAVKLEKMLGPRNALQFNVSGYGCV